MDEYNNQQKQAKNNQQTSHQENSQAKNSSQDSSNDKTWIIFPILVVAIIVFGSLLYVWLRKKRK